MSLTVDQFIQLAFQAGKELSVPAIAAIAGVLLAQWLGFANESTFGAAGFLIGTLFTQMRNWFRSREMPCLVYLCIIDNKLAHTVVFERHKEQAMFRQVQYCQICGNHLVKECPKCGKAITLRAKDEVVGRFCRSCGSRLFDAISESRNTPLRSSLKRRRKRPE